ncbi:Hypothetical_protein [Hexamita inflata]|uniref:Hypothetical_protein n=1 Tax=Hexamita inflata TaxID=28002 RepID=A0AA86NJH7_9EUKA|nr:Hypothetical protein HINF_LOCUS8832 [Hexamita inflata]
MNLIQIKANALLQLEMQKIINSRIKNTQIYKTIEPTQNENTKQQSRLVNKEQQQIINEPQQIKQTQKLDEETKQFIIQYIKEHKELTAAILTFIMNSKFKKMNLPKGLIEQFIKQNYEQYNGEQQTPKHIDKQKENVNIQQKSNMEPIQNMVFNIATKTYQNALQKMTGLDHSKNSPAEICQIINSLEATKYDYFWYKVQGRNPSNSLDEAKYYFNNTYCQTLHAKEQQTQDEAQHKQFEKQSNINKKQTNIQNNDIISLGSSTTLELTSDSEQTQEVRLSQEQDQYIKKYIQEHTQITVPKMAMYLLKTKQLNLTNITSAQLQHFINNQSNQVQQDQSSLINKTKIQQQQLKVVYQPLRQLSEDDKNYIIQYITAHSNLKSSRTIFFLIKQFKHKIAKSVVTQFALNYIQKQQKFDNQKYHNQNIEQVKRREYINQLKIDNNVKYHNELISDNIYSKQKVDNQKIIIPQLTIDKKSQNLVNKYTQLYKACLHSITKKEYSSYSPQQLCEIINSFDQQEQLHFWRVVSQANVELQSSTSRGKNNYENSYKRVLYTENINDNDREYIINFIKQHEKLSSLQQTELLMKSYFQNRSVFHRQVNTFIMNSKK